MLIIYSLRLPIWFLSLIHIYIDVWDFADESEADTKNKGLQEETSNVYGNGPVSYTHLDVYKRQIMGYVSGKVVLVTGGGGSIGSELCRQVASHNPKQLIIFEDVYKRQA